MRKLGLLIIAVLSFMISKAQYTVISDDSTYVPTSANALLEVYSQNGNKGILIPRLTTAQRTALITVAPADNSLLVYDTDTKTYWYFDGTLWVEIVPGGTDDQLLTLSNDTLYIENGNWIYLGNYNQTLTFDDITNQLTITNGNTVNIPDSVNDADADPNNEIELPAIAISGQVLTWNGSAWVAQNAASGADNWGSQVVVSDATLNGDGTSGNPLTVNGDLTDDQQLSLSGNTLSLTDGGSVDLSSINTDNQDLSLSGNTLNITNGSGVDLSAYMDNTDDQNISGSGLSGTTLTIGIENGISETVDLSSLIGTDNQDLSLSGNTLSLTNDATPVDLSGYLDNTDSQTLSLSGNTLSITGGNSVDLSSYGNDWKLTGNAAASTNFIGTTNAIDFRMYTNNSERMTIESNGNVGIGTTAPASKLEVTGGTRIIYSTSPTLYLQNDANSSSNYALQIYSQGSARSWIASNGRGYFADRIGVGTTSPTEAITASGNIEATGIVYWGGSGVRTEDRADAGASGAGIRSGFYQTSAPSPAANWPTGAAGWWHLLDIRHNNTTNNYAMQFAGSFFDQKLYFRKTNNSATTAWNEVTTAATETYTAVSLLSDISIPNTSWTDISGMTLTFTAKKSTILVTVTASGHGYTNSMAYVNLRVWNTTSGVSIGGCSNKIQAYDDTQGTVTVWSSSYSKLVTGLTPGTTYSFKVQGSVAALFGTDDAVIYPVTHPDSEHLTLTVFY